MNHSLTSSRRPQRHWGQHFLNDHSVVESIIRASAIIRGEVVVEIGPGPGILTAALLKAGARVIAIERDRRFEAPLRQSFDQTGRFTISIADAIRLDWREVGVEDERYRVIANIPYSITTPLLEKFLTVPRPKHAILMIQDDVARRLMAKPSSSDRGALSVIMQESFDIAIIRTVHPSAFTPAPKVNSAIVEFVPTGKNTPQFGVFLHQCFRHRRKLLSSNLRTAYPTTDWAPLFEQLGIASTARPQDITNEQWKELSSVTQ